MEKTITLKKLKSVWSGKANPDKKEIQSRFNEKFNYKSNNSVRRRLGVAADVKIPTEQWHWFEIEFGLVQES